MTHVAVIGGGCAGLAAAARLAEHNIPVTLFDSSPQLGGRARGVQWKGHTLDNGQHILLGAYSETLSLLRLAQVNEKQVLLRLPLKLTMQPSFELRASKLLPAPLHILAGFIAAKGLSYKDRWRAIRFMAWMKLIDFRLQQDIPLADLLHIRDQSQALVKILWEPLCLAALNTPISIASGQVFLNVLRDSFSKGKSDSDMLLPKLDLSSLMAEPLAQYIRQHGGQIHTSTSVESIETISIEAGLRQFSLSTANGAKQNFSHVIVAVSPFRLKALMTKLPELESSAKLTEAMQHQPICTIYLQYEASFRLTEPMTGLTQGLGQWVFDRGQLYGQHGLLAIVISAEGEHQQLTQEALVKRIVDELCHAFPPLASNLNQPLWHKVITEKRATFACTTNLKRPAIHTELPRLYLAGDYIAGDYPATIEGAARSGSKAAEAVIQSI